MKICKYVVECSGEIIIADTCEQIQNQYHRGIISFNEMVEERIKIIRGYNKKSYEARNSEMPDLWAVSKQKKSEFVKNPNTSASENLSVVRREQKTRVYPEGYQASPFG